MLKKQYSLLIIILLIMSCASKKDVYYFQDLNQTAIKTNFKPINIQPGDILDVQIKATNPESVMIFQRQSSLTFQQGQLENRIIDGYLVSENSTINMPIIGSIDTTNKTTQILALYIQEALSSYIKNPTVNIRFLNFRVSVLGEVNQPGTFTVLEERFTIPQALGLAGDLTINGDRNNVSLIRSENGKKVNFKIDLTKSEFMQSPSYFL